MPQHAIWKGTISFGLVNIPVYLYSAEKPSAEMHLHLLDKKTHGRIHNQRVNENGKEVSWEDIEHAYEFEKGKYVVVDQKMLERTAAENYETVEIEEFVPFAQINPIYFAKPYYLMPGESGFKGYVLLHDILQRAKMVGIAKVVIKTREHIAAILPQQDYLSMIILRYAKEMHDIKDYVAQNPLPATKIKIQARELELAQQLVKNMTNKWDPKKFHDNNKELLLTLINSDIKKGKVVGKAKVSKGKKTSATAGSASDKVLDFSDLLKKSVAKRKAHK